MNHKKIVSLIMTTLTTFAINTSALTAQSQTTENCFMLGNNGELLNLSNICGENNSKVRKNPKKFKVKIKRRLGGVPVINVIFNKRKTYEMLLDTGASGTVLTVQMAEELGLKPEGYVLVKTPSNNAVPFPTTTVNSIKVGTAELKKTKVAVSPTLSMGLLGQDFFGRYDITIKQDVIEFQSRNTN